MEKVGILGAGTMGTQLALLCAAHGMSVVLWNHRRREDFERSFRKIILLQSRLGAIEKSSIDTVIANVVHVDDILEIASCDLIIEAVKEDYPVKLAVMNKLMAVLSEQKIVATNTSTLSITSLASQTRDPSKFIGVHFFNPPLTMKLVELVRGEYTSDETIDEICQFLAVLHKHPVVLPETPGFVVNRLLFPMINEAIFLLAEGIAEPKTIDNCMKLGANHPMGPLELADFIGLDVCLSILETLVAETGDDKYRPAPLLRKYVRAGKFGKKTGIGFYSYRRGEL
ncbi:3-hydroxybutyryl-CoA dehydrogenase [Oryzomonas rubra]|uniref:3-hydroxybutyryl-CoA dehydrogenase n=1 Tax=Oryzomonas rubra TaxID=2509454 RepID=A0A5A9XL08_9BACT|nr:3-hydroxybutyryl-CoA dehydrogenase [Oryzomonas rubra]